MSDPGDLDDLDVIDKGGRYALTLGPVGHEIWDLDLPPDADPIETYAAGGSGFGTAWARYQELEQEDRRRRGRLVRVLYITAIVAEVMWMVVGLIGEGFYYQTLSQDASSSPTVSLVSFTNVQRLQILDQAIYHIALGTLALLVTIWVGQRLTDPASVRPPSRPTLGDRGSGRDAP